MRAGNREREGGWVADSLEVSPENSTANSVTAEVVVAAAAVVGGARRRARPLILVAAPVYRSYCMWGEEAN